MLNITFNKTKPSQREYEYSIVGNAQVDVVRFVLQSDICAYYLLSDLEGFSAYVKVQSAGGEYIDKISATSSYDSEKETLTIDFDLLKKTTQFKNISLQLQFESDEGQVVAQTEIVCLSLKGSINADKEIPDLFPSVLTQMEHELADHEDRIDALENKQDIGSVDLSLEGDKLDIDIKNGEGESVAKDSVDIPLSSKVDKVQGMGLSHNDFTNTEKTKLSGIEDNAQRNVLEGVKVNGTDLPIQDKKVDIDLTQYALESAMKTYAKSLSVSIDSGTFVISFLLKDSEGNTLSSQSVDLPLESVVVGGRYDSTTKDLILTLKNGQEIAIPLDDIISGLVSETSLATTLENYYTKAQMDTKLTEYAKVNGDYPLLNAGKSKLADNWTPFGEHSGVGQQAPFVFQSTAGGSDVGKKLCQLKELRGQSYALNQMFKIMSYSVATGYNYNNEAGARTFDATNNSSSIVVDSSGEVGVAQARCMTSYPARIINTHKYLVKVKVIVSQSMSNKAIAFRTGDNYKNSTYTTWNKGENDIAFIFTSNEDYTGTNTQIRTYGITNADDGATLTYKDLQCFDLTQMFGAGNEPTTVEEFNRLFPLPYYAYNEGQLTVSQSSEFVSRFYNQFDGEVEIGTLSDINGLPVATPQAIRSKNFTKVVPAQTYTYEANDMGSNVFSNFIIYEYDGNQNYIGRQIKYSNNREFELSQNTHYIKIVSFTNNQDASLTGIKIAFHLTWDGSKTGFEPYKEIRYPLPNVVLRSAGSVYDSVLPSGLLTRRIGVVDLGSLSWTYAAGTGDYANTFRAKLPANAKFLSYGSIPNMITSSKYLVSSLQYNEYQGGHDNTITHRTTHLQIQDTSFGTDANALKTSLNGQYAFYELETPTTEQVEAFEEGVEVDDFGTTEFNSTYPQGNSFFYYVDYKAFVDSVGNREDIGFDASKIVSQTQLQQAMSGIDLSAYPQKASDETITGTWTFNQPIKSDSVDSSSTFVVKINGTTKFAFTSSNILPYGHQDLGSSSYPIKDIYIDGKLKDGTKEVSVGDIVQALGIIKLDTGTYTSGTQMSATDLAQLQPLLNMNIEECVKYLNKVIRWDNSRNETHSTTYISVRGSNGSTPTSAWYDIQIIFPIGATITLTPARLGNGTY